MLVNGFDIVLISLIILLSILLLRGSDIAIDKLIANKLPNIKINNNHRHLQSEYRIVSRNLKRWRLLTKDGKYMTMLRFIKIYEFLTKFLASVCNTALNFQELSLYQSIEALKQVSKIPRNEIDVLEQLRLIRNKLVHQLGYNFPVSDLKSKMLISKKALNNILLQISP